MYCTNWIQAFIINYMCMHLIWFRHKIPHQCKIIKQTKVLLYLLEWQYARIFETSSVVFGFKRTWLAPLCKQTNKQLNNIALHIIKCGSIDIYIYIHNYHVSRYMYQKDINLLVFVDIVSAWRQSCCMVSQDSFFLCLPILFLVFITL